MQSNLIEDSLVAYYGNRDSSREHKERFYPTQSSTFIDYKKYKKLEGKCLRASYYSCLGIEDASIASINQMVTFSLGDYTELMLLDIFNRTGILVDKGTKFEIEEYKISGKLDAIIKDGEQEVGIEIKSIGSNKWTTNSIFGSPWNKPAPKWQNLFQTLVYCYAFRDRIPYFLLCYIKRDTGERQTFKVAIEPINDKIYAVIDGKIEERYTVNDILDRYMLLAKFIEEESIPPMEYIKEYDKKNIKDYIKVGLLSKKQAENYEIAPFGDYECRFCGYRAQCDKDN